MRPLALNWLILLFMLLMLQKVRRSSQRGPGITHSDLLVISKIDLAPYVGASLEVMEADTAKNASCETLCFY